MEALTGALFLAYAQHSFFQDMLRSLGRGVMYAGAFRIMRGMSMPGAIGLVLVVLAIAWLLSRR
jgi:hypothetical protein